MKQDRRAEGRQQNREAQLQEGLGGQRMGERTDALEDVHQEGEQHGAVDRAEGKIPADEGEAHDEQRRVDDEHQHARGEHLGGNHAAQNQREAADAAGGEVVGEFEEVDADAGDQDAEGQEQITLECVQLAGFRDFHVNRVLSSLMRTVKFAAQQL